MIRTAALFSLLLMTSACSTIHRIEMSNLPINETATLSIPLMIIVGKVDGVEVSNPLCTGAFCSAGIEISLTPGEHTVEVRYASAYSFATEFVPLKVNCEKGGKYKLTYVLIGSPLGRGTVKYRIEPL